MGQNRFFVLQPTCSRFIPTVTLSSVIALSELLCRVYSCLGPIKANISVLSLALQICIWTHILLNYWYFSLFEVVSITLQTAVTNLFTCGPNFRCAPTAHSDARGIDNSLHVLFYLLRGVGGRRHVPVLFAVHTYHANTGKSHIHFSILLSIATVAVVTIEKLQWNQARPVVTKPVFGVHHNHQTFCLVSLPPFCCVSYTKV